MVLIWVSNDNELNLFACTCCSKKANTAFLQVCGPFAKDSWVGQFLVVTFENGPLKELGAWIIIKAIK